MSGIAGTPPVEFPVLQEVAAGPSQRPGAVVLTISHGFEIELDTGAWAIAQRFDGSRTVAELGMEVEADGAHVGGGRFVQALASYLLDVGVLTLTSTRAKGAPRQAEDNVVAAPLRHACQMCGRSCQGHYIGPLDSDFLERLPDLHAQMQARFPDLEGLLPTRRVANGTEALTAVGDEHRCLYLGSDGACRVHTTLGAEAKPLVCRLFPILRVRTESEVRVGVTPRCYTFHRSFDAGPPRTPLAITGTDDLPWPLLADIGPADAQEGLAAEAALLDGLRQGLPLETLWSRLASDFLRRPVKASHRSIDRAVHGAFTRLGSDLHAENGPLPAPLPPGSHVEEVARLAAVLRRAPLPAYGGVPAVSVAYAQHTAIQWLHLRAWTEFPSFYAGSFVLLLGQVAASLACQGASEVPAADRFGFALTAWTRVMRLPHNTALLFADEEQFTAVIEASVGPAP